MEKILERTTTMIADAKAKGNLELAIELHELYLDLLEQRRILNKYASTVNKRKRSNEK